MTRLADRFPNDRAACRGVWLPAMRHGFVPQGVAVRGRTGWVSGYDGDQREGELWCTAIRLDLATGRELSRAVLHQTAVGTTTLSCRHGGGLTIDRHGLWLVEAARLWLLDPTTLDVRRAWSLTDGVRGSFALVDDAGRLGLGAFRAHRRGWLDWVDPARLVAGTATSVGREDVLEHLVAPSRTQGAVWGRTSHDRQGVWFSRSTTRCGVLVGPFGRRGFVPGAEGMAHDERGRLWVVSESGSRAYQRAGGRPVIPGLVRLDTARLRAWARPTCSL